MNEITMNEKQVSQKISLSKIIQSATSLDEVSDSIFADFPIDEWLDFMFVNEPVAAYLRDICKKLNIPDEKMFKLISIALMETKNKVVEERYEETKLKIAQLKIAQSLTENRLMV